MEKDYTEIPKLDLYKKIEKSHGEVYKKVHSKILKSEAFKTLDEKEPDAASFFKEEKYKEVPPVQLNNKQGYYNESMQICMELTDQEYKAWWSGYNRSFSFIRNQIAEIEKIIKSNNYNGGMVK